MTSNDPFSSSTPLPDPSSVPLHVPLGVHPIPPSFVPLIVPNLSSLIFIVDIALPIIATHLGANLSISLVYPSINAFVQHLQTPFTIFNDTNYITWLLSFLHFCIFMVVYSSLLMTPLRSRIPDEKKFHGR